MANRRYIIGIDEVGRGALAGPVVVAAALLPASLKEQRKIIANAHLGVLKDSKQLLAEKRSAWSLYFKNHPDVDVVVSRVNPRGIERMNISAAANKAAAQAITHLLKRHPEVESEAVKIILDGGLFIHSRAKQPKNAITQPKADENFPAVSVASIVAKVTRDRFMVKLAKKHSGYGFEVHKGYGTLVHRKAIRKSGPCEAHRLTFLQKKPIMK